jgi:hypothetical protein
VRVLSLLAFAAAFAVAQEAPKQGPEFDVLKKHVGTWTATMNFGGMETKGTQTTKLDLGGLWISGTMECEMFGQKFTGKSLDTYDQGKKKYVSLWADSMSTSPVIMEGTFDAEKKTLTLEGTGPGQDGKPQKYKSTTQMKGDDEMLFTMYMGDAKEAAFTIKYTKSK